MHHFYRNGGARTRTMLGAVKLPFWLSIAALSLVQGGVVALPAAGAASGRLRFLRARQGALIAAVTPARWLGAGIIAMAAADTALVVADQLQRPNRVLQAAYPAAGLPRLQSVVFGSAGMGYGDLFIAGLLGGLLAARLGRAPQVRAALLAAALALAF